MERRRPLKRTGAPQRRTGLDRGKPLARKRRIKAVSDKRLAEIPARTEMRHRVFDRDHNVCRLAHVLPAGCHGGLTAHHLLKESQGGPYTLCNLLTLCAGHNTWVEDRPDAAWGLGLVIRRGDDFSDAWHRLIDAGLVEWWWTGDERHP